VARSQGSDFLDQYFWKGWQLLGEVNRFTWLGRFPGAIRFIAGASRTNSALYSQLTQAVLAGQEDTQNLRAYRTKPMLAANFDQQLNDTWGVFGRVGWNNGRNQNFHFIEMDWSVSAGVAVNGWRWGRFDDTAGLAFNLGGLHAPQRQFIEAGGYGFIIGDGRLNYRPEAIFEAYYDFGLRPGVNFGLGSPASINPNYNADRGPVLVGWLRARAAF
jgi:high affinity Mn2+ porin